MNKLRKAEISAMGATDNFEAVKTFNIRKNLKTQNKKISSTKKMVKKSQRNRKREEKIRQLQIEYLGSTDAVTPQLYNGRKSYVYKCPDCSSFIRDKLSRHLEDTHKYSYNDARMHQSRMRVFYMWCQKPKHETHLPLPCECCHEWHSRLDKHLKTHIVHNIMTEEMRSLEVAMTKEKYWKKGFESSTSPLPVPLTAENEPQSVVCSSYIARSKPAVPQHAVASVDYIPLSSTRLTELQRTKWNIKPDDYFTIYFKNAEDVLDAFQNDLYESGHEKDNSIQHRNSMHLIWASLNKDLAMFPLNPLANIHLFRDFYHRPTYKRIGRKDGVQASTLRSRYVSFGFFIQFLRKNQIFAGMSRMQMQTLEQSVSDFNKELNPHIKQRKVEVRRQKVRQLLRPEHFIAYGQSTFVQGLIKESNKSNKSTMIFTKNFSLQYRDYLIASLVIGNGLRASNVLQLNIKDFENYSVVPGYEGHKVIINDVYKTSTIYGEKFIVMSDALYNHCKFYLAHLRKLVSKNDSMKLFLPSSGTAKKMNQTNVSASLTSSFKLAKVLKATEYQRVSCTRIRCGLATFACNDGGFESAYFAKHFMKNRESTTDLHYNLLSNRRHALNIAMKLYKSFNGADGQSIDVNQSDVDILVQEINQSTVNINKDKVISWLKQNDSSLTKGEIEDFTAILEECSNSTVKGNATKFYGHIDEVCICLFVNPFISDCLIFKLSAISVKYLLKAY